MTNATHCNKIGGIIPPGIPDIDTCRSFLGREIRTVQPKVIIAMGNSALYSVTGQPAKRITKFRGKIEPLDKNMFDVDAKVIYTWHPSYVLRQKGEAFTAAKKDFWRDISLACTMASNADLSWNFMKKPKIDG